ncbi:hypothetical protein TanjilG_12635 [Lupinus angustifolius]|uniref:Uncharacterized protein n=1 Tax=Lupinus angustifolius TaxID=3871 RepID=A0A4P1QZL8_LUPAN|nr:hypothetical protein TanjilG_12635 [Lupinus angustifolius]
MTLLEWFSPLSWWRARLNDALENARARKYPARDFQKLRTIFIVHRPYSQHPATNLPCSRNQAYVWDTFDTYPLVENYRKELENHLSQVNFYEYVPDSSMSTCISHCDNLTNLLRSKGVIQVNNSFYQRVGEASSSRQNELGTNQSTNTDSIMEPVDQDMDQDAQDTNVEIMYIMLAEKVTYEETRPPWWYTMYGSVNSEEWHYYNLSPSQNSR